MNSPREIMLQGAHGDIDIHANDDFHMTCPMSRAIDAGLAALAAEGLTIVSQDIGSYGAIRYPNVPIEQYDDNLRRRVYVGPVLEHTPEERYERPPYDADDAADYPEGEKQ